MATEATKRKDLDAKSGNAWGGNAWGGNSWGGNSWSGNARGGKLRFATASAGCYKASSAGSANSEIGSPMNLEVQNA
ncbi:MAG: hypothetical protein M0P99_09710 [Candidatus Cloacimonetes bacterium]|nr:hypothetical protein [Candidatus Cloacimonadota bacterium]